MSDTMLGLEDKVVVVTGSSQGVGRGCALQFARAGAHVVIVARGLELAEEVAAEVRALGRQSIAVQADVTRKEDVDRMIAATLDKFGRIDVGVNNVGGRGGTPPGSVLESDPGFWQETFEISLFTVLLNTKAFAATMVERQIHGSIVNVASVAALKSTPGIATYGAAKAAVMQLTKTLASELGPYGIRVNAVAPGMVDTKALAAFLTPEERANRVAKIPLARLATPDDIGKAVVLVASDLAGWITGETVVTDGGQSLRG
ncbi:MAG: SDR family oxidoreductase [Chloroflexi bacterium]|nr:SDR family oxidoreductase [Chloroflexota bacterium]